jgi:hypothetical protein
MVGSSKLLMNQGSRWLRELFPEAGKCFTRFQRKHRIPIASHLISKNLALKPARASCRTVPPDPQEAFLVRNDSPAKKKPEADKEPLANPSGMPSSDLFASFHPGVPCVESRKVVPMHFDTSLVKSYLTSPYRERYDLLQKDDKKAEKEVICNCEDKRPHFRHAWRSASMLLPG